MAETPIHRNVMFDLIVMLEDHFGGAPDVYVSGGMMMYYVEGNARKYVSPEVFVTRGIPKLPERDVYKVWEEGKGQDVVIEVVSKKPGRSISAGSWSSIATCSRSGSTSGSIPGTRPWRGPPCAAIG